MHFHRFVVLGSCLVAGAVLTVNFAPPAFGAAMHFRTESLIQQGGSPGDRNRPTPGGQQGRPTQDKHPPQGPRPARPAGNRPAPARPVPQRPGPARPPAQHRPPVRPINRPRPHYNFGDGGNGFRLRRYFNMDMGRVNRNRRPHFVAGGYFPRQYIGFLQPIPPDLIVYLPPVPPGYAIGYYDGYTVVYDPATYLIVSLLDLFRY